VSLETVSMSTSSIAVSLGTSPATKTMLGGKSHVITTIANVSYAVIR